MNVPNSLWQRLIDWMRGHSRITRTVSSTGDLTIAARGDLTIINADIRAGDGADGKRGASVTITAGSPR